MFTAVQEQLGLKLESSKTQAQVVVIDHVERFTRELSGFLKSRTSNGGPVTVRTERTGGTQPSRSQSQDVSFARVWTTAILCYPSRMQTFAMPSRALSALSRVVRRKAADDPAPENAVRIALSEEMPVPVVATRAHLQRPECQTSGSSD